MSKPEGAPAPGFHVQDVELLTCSACGGDGIGDRRAIIHLNKGDQPHEWIERCSGCGGRGKVAPDELATAGELKRCARVYYRMLTLRDEAKRLGITASQLSKIERGHAVIVRESADG